VKSQGRAVRCFTYAFMAFGSGVLAGLPSTGTPRQQLLTILAFVLAAMCLALVYIIAREEP
jgi:hypothetical protein